MALKREKGGGRGWLRDEGCMVGGGGRVRVRRRGGGGERTLIVRTAEFA
jgi:hypothetical protein